MKRYFLALAACLALTASQAQDITDAVLFSQEGLMGTARYKAMSGAFGALGGDLSAVSINPASSTVFNNSYGTLTLGVNQVVNDASYFNGFSNNTNSNLDLAQGGVALVFLNSEKESSWKKFSIGFNYNQQNNLTDEFRVAGTNTNSIDNYFLQQAQGIPLNLLQTMPGESITDLYSYLGENHGYGAQQAMLGYQAFVFNAEDDENPDNNSYVSAIAPGSFHQDYAYMSTGLNGKFSFNFATNYEDRFHLGINLNSHFINHERYTRLHEENSNPGSETNTVQFENNLSTHGTGFSFQLGGIAKLTDMVRVGATYQSPTWFNIAEETTQSLGTYSEEFNETVRVTPDIINIFPDYKINTPAKYTGSLGLVFKDKGLISFDYSYQDFSTTKFKPTNDPAFIDQNQNIAANLQGSSTFRVGGEYRIEKVSLRGGYRFEQSPYKDDNRMGDLNGYSVGLGYDFGSMKLDFAYDVASRDRQHRLYPIGLTDSANINTDFSNYTLSLSFQL